MCKSSGMRWRMKGAAGAAGVLLLVGVAECATTDPNVEFAQQMIRITSRHWKWRRSWRSAVRIRTSKTSPRRSGAQAPEIEQMQTWLAQWGRVEVDDAARRARLEHGMMTAEQMAALRLATRAEFDDLWLEMMIDHHEGAIVMAEEVAGADV